MIVVVVVSVVRVLVDFGGGGLVGCGVTVPMIAVRMVVMIVLIGSIVMILTVIVRVRRVAPG